MKLLKYVFFLSLFLVSCTKTFEKKQDTPANVPPKKERIKIGWLTDKIAKMEIDTSLSYQKGFECDAVIGIDYVGFEGEHFYYPINEKGQFINTIYKKQKLNKSQFLELNSIIGNKKTYENPEMTFCYEPRLAFVYFKNNKVIGQTQICLGCSQIQSTVKTLDGDSGGLINKKATEKLNNLRNKLGFTGKY